jgi:UDP-glucose 4-epimerase
VDRILVTGGAGYIGSHVVAALGEEGYSVLTYDNLATGHRDAVLAGELVVGDLADTPLLEKTLRDFRPAAVMHFAAFIEVGESVRAPLKYYQNNAANTVNLLSAMERKGVGAFIFSSTAAVYGNPAVSPITESSPVDPINPYGRAKAFVERVLQDASAGGGLRYVSLRYFNAAGADPRGRLGERHDPESHLIPLALKTAAGKRKYLSVFGNDYPTPDGTCIRDFIHVADLSAAHVLSLRHLLDSKGDSDVFNCGYGHGHSVREVIETARQVTGKAIREENMPRRPGDPSLLVADSSRLKRVLGWQPHHDDLEFIISTAWDWERKHP